MDVDAVVSSSIQTEAWDLSASGMYINTSGKFEINKQVRIVFTVPGHETPLKLHVKIARIEQDGISKELDVSPG